MLKFLRRMLGTEEARRVVLKPQDVWGGALEVVGESFCQPALLVLAGGRTSRGQAISCKAVLIPYATNPHDANAVRVEIQGRPVGHLSREAAVSYREQIAALGYPMAEAEAAAKIVGGWSNSDGRGSFGVELKIANPLEIIAEA